MTMRSVWKVTGLGSQFQVKNYLHFKVISHTFPFFSAILICTARRILLGYPSWKLFSYGDVLGQELPHVEGITSKCIVMVQQPWFFLPQLSSLLPHWVKQTSQDLFANLLIDHLTLWQELTMDNAHSISSSITFQTDLVY